MKQLVNPTTFPFGLGELLVNHKIVIFCLGKLLVNTNALLFYNLVLNKQYKPCTLFYPPNFLYKRVCITNLCLFLGRKTEMLKTNWS